MYVASRNRNDSGTAAYHRALYRAEVWLFHAGSSAKAAKPKFAIWHEASGASLQNQGGHAAGYYHRA